MTLASAYLPLFQERERSAFWMLVHCILVNRTRGASADRTLGEIRRRWPNPPALAACDLASLQNVLKPIGLSTSRASSLRNLAWVWSNTINPRSSTADAVRQWPGCGSYAADSWAIFIEGRRDISPSDRRLREFLKHERLAQIGTTV
jgi:endonuclease III